jgi:hypothetical protein
MREGGYAHRNGPNMDSSVRFLWVWWIGVFAGVFGKKLVQDVVSCW